MKFRQLQSWEKVKTIPLYREAFPEDSESYISYYYTWKSVENEILVLTDTVEQKTSDCPENLVSHEMICSMLHLNPYNMWISTESITLHYIVAVATAFSFRRQGCMRRLMMEAFSWLYEQKEPFTYLMPADIAYYEPFGFRVIYDQRPVSFPNNIEEANLWAKSNFDVVTLRDGSYMRFLEAEPEQVSEEKKECIQDERIDLQSEPEPSGNSEDGLWKPQIMCRIIHLPRFLGCIRAQCPKKIYLQIYDPLLSENTGFYCWELDSRSSRVTDIDKKTFELSVIKKNSGDLLYEDGVEISRVSFGIEELAEQLFGVTPLHPSLKHVSILSRICINEEV